MSYFFVSYMHEDIDFVKVLEEKLAAEGILVWTDASLRVGDDWKKKIDLSIESSTGVIVVITPASLVSSYVTYEWSYAKGLKKPVIPILLKGVTDEVLRVLTTGTGEPIHERKLQIHPQLGDIQHWDFSEADANWEKLIVALKSILSGSIPASFQKYWEELDSSDSEIRRRAILTLEQYEDDKANDVLAQAIKEKKLPDVMQGCALALARKTDGKDPRVLAGLRGVILNGAYGQDTEFALEVAVGLKVSEVAELLIDALTTNHYAKMRVKIAQILGMRKLEGACGTLLEHVKKDRHGVVRIVAAAALFEMNGCTLIEKHQWLIEDWLNNEEEGEFTSFGPLIRAIADCGGDGIEVVINWLDHNAPDSWNNFLIRELKVAHSRITIDYMKTKFFSSPASEQDFWLSLYYSIIGTERHTGWHSS